MSQKDGSTSSNKDQLNKTKKIKQKMSLIDIFIKKINNSKKNLLQFFKGKYLEIINF